MAKIANLSGWGRNKAKERYATGGVAGNTDDTSFHRSVENARSIYGYDTTSPDNQQKAQRLQGHMGRSMNQGEDTYRDVPPGRRNDEYQNYPLSPTQKWRE